MKKSTGGSSRKPAKNLASPGRKQSRGAAVKPGGSGSRWRNQAGGGTTKGGKKTLSGPNGRFVVYDRRQPK